LSLFGSGFAGLGQYVAGGAVIGGIGGTGVGLILQGFKTTADAFANPLVGTLGMVLAGIAVGAAGGALASQLKTIKISIFKDLRLIVN
jgi:hypothetical protein